MSTENKEEGNFGFGLFLGLAAAFLVGVLSCFYWSWEVKSLEYKWTWLVRSNCERVGKTTVVGEYYDKETFRCKDGIYIINR